MKFKIYLSTKYHEIKQLCIQSSVKYRHSDRTSPSTKEESKFIIFHLNHEANNLTMNFKRDYEIMLETVKSLRSYYICLFHAIIEAYKLKVIY